MLTTNEIKVTAAAREYLRGLILNQAGGQGGLRLAIRSGKGCGGAEYDLAVASVPAAGDETLTVDDTVRVFIPISDTLKLFGTTIDYRADDLGNRRLIIENPNEKGRCGCGESVVL
jgi:iron-sulfur cluster assembly protein